ncbi:AcrR family transcriptional regulator [Novosphingobium hassiacum]|uniref:AcrR family transcriptional regulator n=1 Tax=Novosphingobium hassiacum TaxID=173676 RepID=A0A7W5ZT58_9SPHN|nr:AcrR family transcriptional regulator [Novosphingobium hassiacum]
MAIQAKTYHREDLRGDLLRAGRAYIAEHGHHSLSVRTLAQLVGVSSGAPYHHFKDRRALLLALALDGYAEITQAAADATATGNPREKLICLGMQFVDFATRSPQLLELMYESELTSPAPDPALVVFQDLGHETLVAPVREALAGFAEEIIEVRVLALWSTVYGFASLRRKHMIQKVEPRDLRRDEVTRQVVTVAVDAALQR